MYDIRQLIRTKRKYLKLTQPEFASLSGIGLRLLRELEKGAKTNFSTDTLNRVLNMFGAQLYYRKMDRE